MPFTPYHLGPALLLGLVLIRWLDLPTFLVANVIVDVEPFMVLVLGMNYPLHGYVHTYLIGGLVALILYFVMIQVRPYLDSVIRSIGLAQEWNRKSIIFAAISGIWLHITLDSTLYLDIRPLFPLNLNPFYIGLEAYETVYSLCWNSGIIAIILLLVIIMKNRVS